MQVFYTPRYYADIGDNHVFPIRKFELVRDKLLAQGADIVGNTPEQFAEWIRVEIKKWAEVIRVSGAKVD